MDVEIGAEAALYPEKEYRKWIFVAVYMTYVCTSSIDLYDDNMH